MRKKYLITITSFLLILNFACKKDYLDVVPDNVATIDHAFANRNEAEKFLFTCYSYLPREGMLDENPGFNAGDELWIYWPLFGGEYRAFDPYNIARGLQTKVNPNMNYWDGYSNRTMWQGIRNCNIFLENIDKVLDVQPYIKERWIAEVKFLKAYFHWYLFRMYGPIPIMDKNLAISATPEEINVFRQPVDSVVNYISNLIDESVKGEGDNGLPLKILNESTELGRVTKVAALSIKARLLVTAASPLFNGNSDFSGLQNSNGTLLFNPEFEEEKWTRASIACKEAIEATEAADHMLYVFNPAIGNYSEAINIEMSIRNAVAEKWNSELLWGSTAGSQTHAIQVQVCPNFDANNYNLGLRGSLAPTHKMAELFYTENGVPIEEDKTWDYDKRYELRNTTPEDIGLQENYRTVGLHFNREPRFYADLGFDGSKWFMKNGNFTIKSKLEQHSAKRQSLAYSVTGYYAKKLVNWNMVVTTTSISVESYPWPIMRLADLYLLYAESLNEIGNRDEALNYLNKIRERAGLESIENSWSNYSNKPDKYLNTVGLREIIQQERGIEMAFEGSRFWDLRRWKTAPQVLNAPIYGWDIDQSTYEDYNQKVFLFNQKFNTPRDYFWPIREYNLQINPNLVQNLGW